MLEIRAFARRSLNRILALRRFTASPKIQAFAELYRQQRGNTSCGAANRRSEKNVQQRRPPPAADTGRSCWGRGQQDTSATQGTKWSLGTATRLSAAASFFPFRLLLWGLKGASSPFLVDPARRNRWCFSGSLLARKRELSPNAKALCPRATGARTSSKFL